MIDIYIDVETTGTNEHKNGIWQLAAVVYKGDELMYRFNKTCNIFPNQESHPKALELNNLTEDMVAGMDDPRIVYKDFHKMCTQFVDPYNRQDKMFFYAYNAPFDHRFLRKWFYNNGDKFFGSLFFTPILDIMVLAGEKLKERIPTMKNFKQETVAKELGIEVDQDKLHDALYDIQITRQIHKALKEL